MKRRRQEPPSADDVTQHPLIQAVFQDPRYVHLRNFGDLGDPEPEEVGYDRALTLQALAAMYSLISAETQSRALAKATWALCLATLALVVATVALIFTGG